MQYKVLGKLEVTRDDEVVDIGSFRHKALLAYLLTTPNTVVSTDRIIDALWGDEAGPDRQNALWVYISGLRTALEPDREKRSEGTVLLTRTPGYLLQVDPAEIDAVQFEHLVSEGRALVDTDPAAASLVLGEALSLWGGRAYEEFTYEAFATSEIARLEELRLEATAARIDADLRRGMSRELVSELESLVREHPLREQLTGQAMVALYRSGRQAEALRAYQFLKSRLGEELGIEPSQQLQTLEERIVLGDPALEPATSLDVTGFGLEPGLAVRGYELREEIGEGGYGVVYRAYQPAVGREVAIKVIRPELANDPAFIRRFEAEAQRVAQLEDPHIVPLYDYWREPNAAYLVLRLMGRGSLRNVIDTTALAPEEAARVVTQVGSALATAHEAGLAHGDLRPENVLIDDAGNAFLADFAIATGNGSAHQLTRRLDAPYAAPELADGSQASPAADIFSLGVVMAQAVTGLAGGPGQIGGALAPGLAQVVGRATDPNPTVRYSDVLEFAGDFVAAVSGDEPAALPLAPADVENPYKGLRPFAAVDAPHFFGRERLVERLVSRLGEPGSQGCLVAVVGPSGSGKSSVVKAGLLPALRNGAAPQSDEWFIAEMTPGRYPFEELEHALLRVAVDPPASLLEQLSASEAGLRQATRELLPDGSQLLLVVDQFEELFTQVDDDTADRFIDALVAAVRHEHTRIRVLVTLRADFYDRPLRHRGLGELLREGTEIVTPMSPPELERAISGPAQIGGVAFEPALVADLVQEVANRPSTLPLLQYTLTELFEGRTSATITLSDYAAIGGVSGALVERAEGLLTGLSTSARQAARQVFLRLVTLGEGTEDTRRRVLDAELRQLPVSSQDLDHVLDTFGRHRMLSFDRDPITRGPTVEISHEALLSEWTRFRGWINEARDDVRNQRRLGEALREWEGAGRTDEYLLSGGRLQRLSAWAATTSVPLSAVEKEMLTASLATRDRAAEEERVREQRAEEAERSARQRLKLLAIAGVASVVVAALAVFAFVQRQAATRSEATIEQTRRSLELAAEANRLLGEDPELALLVAVEAARITSDSGLVTPEAVDSLHWALHANRIQYPADEATPIAVRSGPQGVTGVFALPPTELAAVAAGATDRRFSAAECERLFSGGPCPDLSTPLPDGLGVFGGEDAYGVTANVPGALQGTSVSLDAFGSNEDLGLAAELARFEEELGIIVTFFADMSADTALGRQRGAGTSLPDIGTLGFLGELADKVREGLFVDLTTYLDLEAVRDDYGSYLSSLVTVGVDGSWPAASGGMYGLPMTMGFDGLVYYPRVAFEQAGYEIPATWDELMALSAQMVEDGRTPWCVAFESGEAGGWPGTEWIESLLVREDPDLYDGWTFHEVAFDAPQVAAAAQRFDDMITTPGFIRGGKGAISRLNVVDQGVFPMLSDAPACWMFHEGDWVFFVLPAHTQIGQDVDFFFLPPVDHGRPTPVTGNAVLIGAHADRPEVRAFAEYVASPRWGEVWAANSTFPSFLSASTEFDVSLYGSATNDGERSSTYLRLGAAMRDAIATNSFHFDASDMMPSEIGSFRADGSLGAFWRGMQDYADGIRTLPQVLADIEAEWTALEAEGG